MPTIDYTSEMNAPIRSGYAADDPIERFNRWFNQAQAHPYIQEANAMNLATVSVSGLPSSRMVLLKEHDRDGFVFYTNLDSHKGEDLKTNPNVALCFYWEPLGKQIRIEGRAESVGAVEADEYFASRPRGSQIGAWASAQSQPLRRTSDLALEIARHTKRFGTRPIPRPPHWSGFRVKANLMEFWKRGTFRVHKRDQYTLHPNSQWRHEVLSP